jgi:multidrug efflux pump subunit AcrB
MIDQFVDFCLRKRVAVIAIAVLLSLYGIYAWETLSVEAYPELGDVSAQVTTQMPGLAAEEVEQLITVPLEREINGTPGLLLMRSESTFGLSLITVLFHEGYEDYWVRQRLLERINQVTLPNGAAPSSTRLQVRAVRSIAIRSSPTRRICRSSRRFSAGRSYPPSSPFPAWWMTATSAASPPSTSWIWIPGSSSTTA